MCVDRPEFKRRDEESGRAGEEGIKRRRLDVRQQSGFQKEAHDARNPGQGSLHLLETTPWWRVGAPTARVARRAVGEQRKARVGTRSCALASKHQRRKLRHPVHARPTGAAAIGESPGGRAEQARWSSSAGAAATCAEEKNGTDVRFGRRARIARATNSRGFRRICQEQGSTPRILSFFAVFRIAALPTKK